MNYEFNKLDALGGGIVIGEYANNLFLDWIASKPNKYELIKNDVKLDNFKARWFKKCSIIRSKQSCYLPSSTSTSKNPSPTVAVRVIHMMSCKKRIETPTGTRSANCIPGWSNGTKRIPRWFLYNGAGIPLIHGNLVKCIINNYMVTHENDPVLSIGMDVMLKHICSKIIDANDPMFYIGSRCGGHIGVNSDCNDSVNSDCNGSDDSDDSDDSSDVETSPSMSLHRMNIELSLSKIINRVSSTLGKLKLSELSLEMFNLIRKINFKKFGKIIKDSIDVLSSTDSSNISIVGKQQQQQQQQQETLTKVKTSKKKIVKKIPILMLEVIIALIAGDEIAATALLSSFFGTSIDTNKIKMIFSNLEELVKDINILSFSSKFSTVVKSFAFDSYTTIVMSVSKTEKEGHLLVKKLTPMLSEFFSKSNLLNADSKLVSILIKLLALSADLNLISVVVLLLQKEDKRALKLLTKALVTASPKLKGIQREIPGLAFQTLGDIKLLMSLAEKVTAVKKQ